MTPSPESNTIPVVLPEAYLKEDRDYEYERHFEVAIKLNSQTQDSLYTGEESWHIERLEEDLCRHFPVLPRVEWRFGEQNRVLFLRIIVSSSYEAILLD